MQQIKDLAGKIHAELQNLTGSVNDVVQDFKNIQAPGPELRKTDGESGSQTEETSGDTAAPTQQIMERVENLMKITDGMVQEISTLRKALPATYFKNRSKIRDTFNKIEETALQNMEEAFAVFDALQALDTAPHQVAGTAAKMEGIRKGLQQLLDLIEKTEDIGESDSYL
ncbi:MAG: hypothetical protein GWO41_02715 [candidate division Zixibacteria bacterium]|nr:hypothetical protein [candidate division Zixibacteria bacterium]NIR63595.1 hypothetical protein [candidate division Zixibacteria bacterium]NIS15178.1 hypothetical protein [candidate division Zixibacteria bacterium]NIS45563.1 hypothetical protein [candidate division Zixibacteria bacterium]NIT51676.1 hypothetical protein [candidate division Zixibacteria bacterium]